MIREVVSRVGFVNKILHKYVEKSARTHLVLIHILRLKTPCEFFLKQP